MPIIGNLSSAGKKPTTPTIGTATDGGTGTTASVAFTASSYIGKGTITYTALSSPGSLTGTGSGSPITVSGLTTGTAYTFTVKGDTNYGVASDYSAASNSVTPASPSSFESIATVTLASPSATITFSSIAGTYKSLQIRLIAKTAGASVESMDMRLNGVSTSSYYTHYLNGNGTSAGASAFGPFTSTRPLYSSLAPTGSSGFSAGIIDIIDYASTSKNKTIRTFGGYDNNGSGNVGLVSGLYFANTNAITSIAFTNGSGNFVTGSTFALYGVK